MKLTAYYLCGICEHCHPAAWNGDCREDQNRYAFAELDDRHGPDGWTEVPMPGTIFALCSSQGTACSETVLTAAEYADPSIRARTEAQFCHGNLDDPLPGSWADVSDNDCLRQGQDRESYTDDQDRENYT